MAARREKDSRSSTHVHAIDQTLHQAHNTNPNQVVQCAGKPEELTINQIDYPQL